MIQPVPVALLLAAGMAWWWHVSGRRAILVMAMLWLSYASYEYLMYLRVLCSGDCNIRIDLLLIYPALLGGTLTVALHAATRAIKRMRNRAEPD